MKSKFDLKHNIGRITPESQDDLFILKDIITPGDFITAKSPRSVKVKRGDELVRPKTGRREVILTIQVEKMDFQENLRLTGKITEAPEDVEKGYHTIEVEPETFLTIQRIWRSWEIDRMKAAERKPEPVLVCILDDTEADFYFIKERYKHLFHIESGASGKGFELKRVEQKRKEYYSKLLNEFKNRADRVKKIVIAGPGFARDDILKLVKEREKTLLEKIIVEKVYDVGEVGFQELLNEGLLEKLTKFSRITEETKNVERLLEEIKKNGNAVYGKENVMQALDNGSVDLLLVSDKKIREFEGLLSVADRLHTKIMVINSEHQSGEKLLGLGGIAALLKFR